MDNYDKPGFIFATLLFIACVTAIGMAIYDFRQPTNTVTETERGN